MNQDAGFVDRGRDALPQPSEALVRLGFWPGEQVRCRSLGNSRILLPARVAGAPARLVLDTGYRNPVWLFRAFMGACELPWEPRDAPWGDCTKTIRVEALGIAHEYGNVSVYLTDSQLTLVPPIAGGLGLAFTTDALVGIDPAAPAVSCSDRVGLRPALPEPVCRFQLISTPAGEAPVTEAVHMDLSARAPSLAIDTGHGESALSLTFVEGHAASRVVDRFRGIARDQGWAHVTLTLPNGACVTQRMRVLDPSGLARYNRSKPQGCDGRLGMDFLRRWVTVFDPSRREMLVYRY
jgi:hypothetical protein